MTKLNGYLNTKIDKKREISRFFIWKFAKIPLFLCPKFINYAWTII